MDLNQAGIALIKEFESCRLTVYKDIVGRYTVGFGHMDDSMTLGDSITQAEADRLLETDLDLVVTNVKNLLTSPLNDNQFSALVSLAYNIGCRNFGHSTLLTCINTMQLERAADKFLDWCHAGGKEVPGLLRRREAERALFLS